MNLSLLAALLALAAPASQTPRRAPAQTPGTMTGLSPSEKTAAAHVAAACGVIFWLNSIRRGWVGTLAGMAISYAFLFAGVGSAFMFLPALGVKLFPPDMPHLSHWLLLGIGLAWGLVAVAIIKYAIHRWMKIEWGDYAG